MGEPKRSPAEGSPVGRTSMDGVGLLEGDAFVTVTDELAATFGYDDPDALVGTPWHELYATADRERIDREALPQARAGRQWHGEVTGTRADGSTCPHRLSIRVSGSGSDDSRVVWVVRELGRQSNRASATGRVTGPAVRSGNGNGRREPNRGRGGRGTIDHSPVDPSGAPSRLLIETAPLPAIAVTAERGIVEVNEAAVDLVGADDREALLGVDPEQLVHPEDSDRARRRLRRVFEERVATGPTEYRLVGEDDEERHVELSATPATYDGELCSCVFVNDVTQLRQAQNRLRRERRFLETVIDAVDDIVYVIDEEGRAYLWNEVLAETTGYSHEEIESMYATEFVPEGHHEYVPGLMEAIDSLDDRRIELDVLTSDGDRIEHEFRGSTFEDPETGDVYRCGIARDITERLERERRLERYETIVETINDGIYALDKDLRFSFVNEGFCGMLGRSREDLLGQPVRELFAFDDEREFADEIRRRVAEGDASTGNVRGTYPTDDGDRILESRYRLLPELDGEFRGSVGVVRDVTEREERKRELEVRLDELETLDRINRILRETTRELVESADRRAIEGIVCSQLADSDLYEFAWIGERAFDGDRIVPRTAAGDDRGYLDAIETRAHGSTGGPADRALRTGEVHVVRADDPAGGPWPDAAGECGFGSIAAVPLRHDGTVYGVLTIHTAREDAFSDRVQDDFDVLGRTVGFVVNAVRSHDLLFSDAVVELELHLAGEGSVVATLASDLDCELELEGHVAPGRRWVLYLDVRNGRLEEVVALANDEPGVERARVVRTSDAGGRVELVVSNPPLLTTLRNAGASVRTLTAEPQGIRLIAEVPVDCDVREVLEPIRREFPDTRLDARRDRDRGVTTAGQPDGILDGLTDRQREALEAAYRAGYFAWPRDSTANEVAESLDLASATLHGHLRKAEATIIGTLFDDA